MRFESKGSDFAKPGSFSEAAADHDTNVAYIAGNLKSEFPWPSLSTNISRRVQVKSHVGAVAEEGDKKHICVGPAANEDADEGSGSEVVDVGSGSGDDGDDDHDKLACSPLQSVFSISLNCLDSQRGMPKEELAIVGTEDKMHIDSQVGSESEGNVAIGKRCDVGGGSGQVA